MLRFGLVLAFFLSSSCVTPMSPAQVESVTTCKNTTLKQIRKNLLLAGYEISDQTSEDIVTNWKQTGGYDRSRYYERVTVVKLGEQMFRFKVMKRNIRVEKENQATLSTTKLNKKQNRSETVDIEFGRDIERADDYDSSYYVEHEAEHRSFQAEICGA